ncbi:hypothetical protein L9F63_024998 [Diploptera punctata]|uniref:Uncharacterized protein n=1 Tax=Diploptera punctata TaxID=6984 RepID=A0AAD7ZDU9_DIPPU|nr:hypothetical protein L9F63_024998 [Diploptera punctata]
MDKRVYQPRHPMESTPFLIKTPTPDEPWQSTTRSTFVPPRNDMLKREGKIIIFQRIALGTYLEFT